jgi:hypothetical protein
MRTNRVLSALSAGWKKSPDGFKAYPVQMCGARSWNEPYKYLITGNTFAAAELSGSLGFLGYNPNKRLMDWARHADVSGFYNGERAVLSALIHNAFTAEDVQQSVRWLRDGPGFHADARIIRTDKMVAWCNETTCNTGSTSYMMAHAWFANPADRPAYYARHKWVRDKHHAWVTIDPPGRSKGAQGRGYVQDGTYYAQRTTARRWKNNFVTMPNSWFDELSGREVPGWRSQLRLAGNRVYDIAVGRGGVVPVGGGNEPPVDPPPNPGGGWHTVKVDRGYLKFNDATALKAIETIEGGNNHVSITQVALEPADLSKLLVELKRIMQ